ncbi:MAG TPA: Mur ligase family protein [Candidatus Limnocylindrales bacterium]|nr:Mur ligase family protein [Candidatus Limnocylindrales bacterium]
MSRTAADIGAGLDRVRGARAIRPGERIHVVGIAGAGASGAALLAAGLGAEVSGCDSGGPSPYAPALEAAGIPIEWQHEAAHVAATAGGRPDRLAVTKALTSIDPDNAELDAARRLGIPLEPWQQVVADAGVGRRLVAVAGTHGKSTTAGWLTHVLAAAGRDPSAFVGALLPSSVTGAAPATARTGRGSELIVEADEYAGNFDAYRPDLVAITNVDWDHPDVFADRGAVVEAFARWIELVPAATLVVNVGDEGADLLRERLAGRAGRRATVAVDGSPRAAFASLRAEIMAAGPAGTTIAFVGELAPARREVTLRVPGRHNVANAAVVAAAARELGVEWPEIMRGLETFEGVGRRLERKGEVGGVAVYDDYGHHPTAIRATLEAVRQREPGRRVWVAHEPLTFHRTAALGDDLAAALADADAVAVADIWAGRDRDTSIASARELARTVARLAPGMPAEAPGDVEATASWLASQVRAGDVVLVMGGGRSYRIADGLLERLRRRAEADSAS